MTAERVRAFSPIGAGRVASPRRPLFFAVEPAWSKVKPVTQTFSKAQGYLGSAEQVH